MSGDRSKQCDCVITGAGSPHKPYLCECVPPPPCWCCTGGMGCSQRPQTTQRLGGLARLCHLWPSRWYCIPGDTQGILLILHIKLLLHSPGDETFPSLVFLFGCYCPAVCKNVLLEGCQVGLHTLCCASDSDISDAVQ